MSELQNIFSLTIKSFKRSNLVTIIVCTKLSFPYQILYVAKFFWMNIFVLLAHLFALYRVSYRGRDARGYPLPSQSSPLHFLKSSQLDQKSYLKIKIKKFGSLNCNSHNPGWITIHRSA